MTGAGGNIAPRWKTSPTVSSTFWPWISTKAPHCSNRSLRRSLLQFWFVFIPSQVERLVMYMSAHQVPAMDNNPKAFLGSSLKNGWIPRQFPSVTPSLHPSRSWLSARSKSILEAWLLPLPAVSFSANPYLTPDTPATLKSLQVHEYVVMVVSLHLLLWFLMPGAWVFPTYPSRFTQHISKSMTWT